MDNGNDRTVKWYEDACDETATYPVNCGLEATRRPGRLWRQAMIDPETKCAVCGGHARALVIGAAWRSMNPKLILCARCRRKRSDERKKAKR